MSTPISNPISEIPSDVSFKPRQRGRRMYTYQLKLPHPLYKELQLISQIRGSSVAEMIREAVVMVLPSWRASAQHLLNSQQKLSETTDPFNPASPIFNPQFANSLSNGSDSKPKDEKPTPPMNELFNQFTKDESE